jgi:methylglutaconyl-CoA hydratase
MMPTTLKLEYDGPVATLTLNRPEKRNAISAAMLAELPAALAEAEHSSARVLILTGAGQAFCAGMDLEMLKAIAAQPPEAHLEDSQRMARLFRAVYDFPRPVIAAVNGPAIAGGCGLVTVCDFVVAVPEAKFGYTEVRIGFVPAIVSVFLRRQVGERIVRDLLLTGRIFDAAEAHRIGLVNEIVPAETLLARARELAGVLLANSPTSLSRTKKLLREAGREALDRELEAAVRENAEIRSTPDFREGVASFLEKRNPVWKGE